MTDDPANFRELNGVGPTTEAELQEAGVRTWSSLAKVLSALLRVKGVAGDTLRGLRDEARQRVSEADVASDTRMADRNDDRDASDETASRQAEARPAAAEDATREPSPEATDGAREHALSLHAGGLIGGHGRRVDLTLATTEVDSPHLTYDARLVARTYGDPQAAWATLGRLTGHAAPPEDVALHFGEVDLEPGVYRTRLDLTVTLPAPSPTTPAITLA